MSTRLTLNRFFLALICLVFIAAGCSDDGGGNNDRGGTLTDAGADGNQVRDADRLSDGATSDAGEDAEEDVYVPECPSGEMYCDYQCRNVLDSTEHCGGCGMTCPSWNAVCDEGECICNDETYTYCNGFCVDTQIDPINCGTCGTTCSDAEVCHDGDCKTVPERVVEETNAARSTDTDCGQYGVIGATSPLVLDPELSKAAQAHADDMAANDFMSHTGSDGSDFVTRVERTNYQGNPIGENVAAGQKSAAEVVAAWVDSDGHCRNIMNPDVTKIGVGYAETDRNGGDTQPPYWVQVFGN